MKTCRTCKVEKAPRHFYRHPSYADGRMSDCKVCKRAYQREMHWLKRESILARKRAYSATPKSREARRLYAQSPRGRELHRESCRIYLQIRREARA